MTRFPTPGHLCAWAGVAPASYESAGKRRPAGTRRGSPYLLRTVIEAARAAARTKGSQSLVHTGVLPARVDYLERLVLWLEGLLADEPPTRARVGLTGDVDIAKPRAQTTLDPISADDRWGHLRRLLTDEQLPLDGRAADALVLLYGLPVGRISEVRADDIVRHDGQTYPTSAPSRSWCHPRSLLSSTDKPVTPRASPSCNPVGPA